VRHELIVKESLTFGERTEHKVLKLPRKFLLYITLETPEQVKTV